MNEIDTAINELAGEIVAHPANSRRFLCLTGPECAHAAEVYAAFFSNHYRDPREAVVVMRASFLSWHCGRRMAIVKSSMCKCGQDSLRYARKVCTCFHCDYSE